MIAVSGRVKATPDPYAPQLLKPAGPRGDWPYPAHLVWPSAPAVPVMQTELPWMIRLTARPAPHLNSVDVLQAGLPVGLRAVEGHAWWHVPQTVCRPGRRWGCTLDDHSGVRSHCSTVWLLPSEGHPTDSATPLHCLALIRSTSTHNRASGYGS